MPDSLLTGKAGAGKTGCVIEFIEVLQSRHTPMLAFRLDRIEPMPTTRALGERLGLEESPAAVLTQAAKENEAVLIVDQLDAISAMSGRTSGLFDVIEALLSEVRGHRTKCRLHVLLICREFDWSNDPQLNRLMPSEQAKVEVSELSLGETNEVLNDAGFKSSVFSKSQLEVLRLPQNLSLFLDARFDPGEPPTFNSGKQLFDRYWDTKRDAIAQRSKGMTDQWAEALDTMTQEMTRTQLLYVPKEKLDKIAKGYIDQMVSEGVLAFDGKRYGFGHESFFDYAFARSFVRQDQSLVAFPKRLRTAPLSASSGQASLTYLRDADRKRYREELAALLIDKQVRIHLKDLAIGVLAATEGPFL